jgi:hypothetical protein
MSLRTFSFIGSMEALLKEAVSWVVIEVPLDKVTAFKKVFEECKNKYLQAIVTNNGTV